MVLRQCYNLLLIRNRYCKYHRNIFIVLYPFSNTKKTEALILEIYYPLLIITLTDNIYIAWNLISWITCIKAFSYKEEMDILFLPWRENKIMFLDQMMDNLGFFKLDKLEMNICECSSFCNFI